MEFNERKQLRDDVRKMAKEEGIKVLLYHIDLYDQGKIDWEQAMTYSALFGSKLLSNAEVIINSQMDNIGIFHNNVDMIFGVRNGG